MQPHLPGGLTVFSAATWTWRALRGHSVTFAILLGSALLGLSILRGVRHLLSELHAPWYAWLIVPVLLIAYFAKKEEEWIPDAERRKTWARRVLYGSVGLAVLIAWWK